MERLTPLLMSVAIGLCGASIERIAWAVDGGAARPDPAKDDLALALNVPASDVVEAHRVELHVGDWFQVVIVGRYHQHGGELTFPVLGVYFSCGAKTCIRAEYLGAAASKVAVLRLIDLDAPRIQISGIDDFNANERPSVPEEPVRWPALIVATAPTTAEYRSLEFFVISLRKPSESSKLFNLEVVHEEPPPKISPSNPMPPNYLLGKHVGSVTFEHQGAKHTVTVVSWPIPGHDYTCRPPTSEETQYLLKESGLEQVSNRPSDLCPSR